MNSILTFWILIAISLIVIALVIYVRFMRINLTARTRMEASTALRDAQLAELNANIAAGKIEADQAEKMTNEIQRAFSRTARRGEDKELSTGPTLPIFLIVAIGLIASVFAYQRMGIPGLEDFGIEKREALKRPSQETAIAALSDRGLIIEPAQLDSSTQDLLTKLKDAIENNPNIAEGYMHLQTLEKSRNNFVAAYQAQNKYIELKGNDATADDYALLAEDMILATEGYVSPEAETAIRTALKADPENITAQYYMALTMKQEGALENARMVFSNVRSKLTDNPAWTAEIDHQITQIDTILTANNGPSAEQIEAAGDMNDDERAEMIGGMVEGLKARLAQEGGTPEEWARLITSLRVLGRDEEAAAILTEAKRKFPENTAIMALE